MANCVHVFDCHEMLLCVGLFYLLYSHKVRSSQVVVDMVGSNGGTLPLLKVLENFCPIVAILLGSSSHQCRDAPSVGLSRTCTHTHTQTHTHTHYHFTYTAHSFSV